MSLSSYNPHNRYRERAQARMTNAISMVLVIALSACVGFWMGKQYGVEKNISLEDQVENLTKERNTLQGNVTELRAEAQTANTRYEQIKAEYNAILPEGPMQDLTKLVRQQIDQGMAPERLSFVIKSVQPVGGRGNKTFCRIHAELHRAGIQRVRCRWRYRHQGQRRVGIEQGWKCRGMV